eukprot:scaffold3030_cov305-Prasinococcus_capsulatus_cf.AAC.1
MPRRWTGSTGGGEMDADAEDDDDADGGAPGAGPIAPDPAPPCWLRQRGEPGAGPPSSSSGR